MTVADLESLSTLTIITHSCLITYSKLKKFYLAAAAGMFELLCGLLVLGDEKP